MKNVIVIFILSLVTILPVFADQGILSFEYGKPIIVQENVENTTGLPCTNCDCNFTLYNPAPDESKINLSIILTKQGNGIYNTTLPQLPLNTEDKIYPVVLFCNSSSFYGVSGITGIRVKWNMFDWSGLVMIPVVICILFAYLSFKVNDRHVFLKWSFFLLSIMSSIAFSVLGSIVSSQTGVPGLATFFDALIYVTSFIFIATLIYMFSTFIHFKKEANRRLQQGY